MFATPVMRYTITRVNIVETITCDIADAVYTTFIVF